MPKRKNYEINQIIGNNKIIELDIQKTEQYKRAYWKCECLQCHKIRSIRQDSLTQMCKSCAAKNRKSNILDDLTDRHFGYWTVIKKATQQNYWTCKCKCGTIRDVFRGSLIQGTSKGCGCVNSWGETQLINLFNKYNINYHTQVTFSDLITDKNRKPRFDFGIYKNTGEFYCLIEYDGRQHKVYNKNWKLTKKDFERLQYLDNLKNKYCIDNNIILYRLDKNTNLEQFVKILKILTSK